MSKNDHSHIFNEIKKSLEVVSEPRKLMQLSRIEIDLVREKLRVLYDHLSGMEGKGLEIEPENPVEFEFEIPGKRAISPEVVEEKIQQSETDPTEIESDELLSEKVARDENPPRPAGKSGQPDLFTSGAARGKPEIKTVIDSVAIENQKESIADSLQKRTKAEHLKNAIGINEKFFFINELFEGNLNDYNTVIESLDGLRSLDESLAFLEKLSLEYNWQGRAEAVDQLKQFLERKLK